MDRYLNRVSNQSWCAVCVALAGYGAWPSSASATLTVWTDQAAWMAAVQPGWSVDFPGGPLMQVSADYYASSGIQLGLYFNPAPAGMNFYFGSISPGRFWETRGALWSNTNEPGLLFAQPVSALAVVAPTSSIQPMSVKYADGTTQFVQVGQLTLGWNFFGFTSTVPIIGYSQYNTPIDQLWLSNPVPAPGVMTLLALAAPVWVRRRRW